MLDRKIAEQATKNTEYQMEIETFVFCFSRVFLFLYFFFTPVPPCYFILNMFLAAACFLTGTDVVLGLQWHCSGVTETVCVSAFSGFW